MTLHSEIFEQPESLQRVLAKQREAVEQIAQAIQSRGIQYAFLAARGTSDNAGRYANYLWGGQNGLPVALATPSLFSLYHQPPKLGGALVIGVSQSGQSPDIVSVLEEGRRQGCLTLAITNAPRSPLAQSADFVLDIMAGEERAVAASKTYTGELMAIAMLSTALSGSAEGWEELSRVPIWVGEVLSEEAEIARMAQRYRYMRQCVVLGRGYNYSTTFEWALKLKEMAYVEAEPYSSADFLHGPIAIVERGFPVMAVVPQGRVFDPLLSLLTDLKEDHLAELVVISNDPRALVLAQSPIQIPAEVPEWLSPLVSIVPAQLFTYHLTLVKSYDPDQPRSIHKVTRTR
jgi:glucosamine--fructose-6-phosphate aminotransferase (isomerizing)